MVGAGDFYLEPHRMIFTAMLAVHRDGADVDPVTLKAELQRMGRWQVVGGESYIDALETAVPHFGHPETYARRVSDLARRRDVQQNAAVASSLANDPDASREQVAAALERMRTGWECGGNELPSMTAAEIDRVEWPEVSEWLVGGWWGHEACGFLAAFEKSSKTIIALGLALSIATGTRWLNRWDVQKGPVVAVFEEDHKRRIQRRLRLVGRALGIDWRTADLHISAQEGCNIRDDRGRGRLAALVRRVKPVLLIVDPWRRVTPGVDEKDSEKVAAILGWLRRVQVENHCAVMVLDHYRKEPTAGGDQGRAAHKLRGSGDKAAWYDSLILVRRKGDDDPEHRIRALHRDASPMSEQVLRIVWDDEHHDLRMHLEAPPGPQPAPIPPRDRTEPREPEQTEAF